MVADGVYRILSSRYYYYTTSSSGHLSTTMRNDPSLFLALVVTLARHDVTVQGFAAAPTFSRSSPCQSRQQRQEHPSSLLLATTTTTTTVDGRAIASGGTVQPVNNFLLVKIAEAQEETAGGILLTGKAKVKKTQGTVVAAGPGMTHAESGILVKTAVAPGETVVYGKYDGTEVNISGNKHTLIREQDVLVKYAGDALTIDAAAVLADNVLIKVDAATKETEGGILIAAGGGPGSSSPKPSTGEVVRVGPGRVARNGELMPIDVEAGDLVKFRDFAGNSVTIQDEEYTVVPMSDILAKF